MTDNNLITNSAVINSIISFDVFDKTKFNYSLADLVTAVKMNIKGTVLAAPAVSEPSQSPYVTTEHDTVSKPSQSPYVTTATEQKSDTSEADAVRTIQNAALQLDELQKALNMARVNLGQKTNMVAERDGKLAAATASNRILTANAAGLQEERDKLQKEKDDMSKKHRDTTAAQLKQIEDFQKTIDEKKQELQKVRDQIKDKEREIVDLQGDLAEKRSRITELERLVRDAEKQQKTIDDQNKSIDEMRAHRDRDLAELERVQRERDALESRIAQIDAALNESGLVFRTTEPETKAAELSTAYHEVLTQRNNLEHKIDTLEQNHARMREDLERTHSEFIKLILQELQTLDSDAQSNVANLTRMLGERESQVATMERNILKLKNKLGRNEGNDQAKNDEIVNLQIQLADLRQDRLDLTNQLNTLRANQPRPVSTRSQGTQTDDRLEKLINTVTQLQSDITKSASQVSVLESEIQRLHDQNKQLMIELSKQRTDNTALRSELLDKTLTIDELRARIREFEKQIWNFEQKLKDCNDQLGSCDQIVADNDQLQQDLQHARQQASTVHDRDAEIADLTRMIAGLNNQLLQVHEAHARDLASQNRLLNDLKRQNDADKYRASQYDARLHANDQLITRLNANIHKLQQQNQQLQTDLENCKAVTNDIDQLKQENDRLQAEVARLRSVAPAANSETVFIRDLLAKIEYLETQVCDTDIAVKTRDRDFPTTDKLKQYIYELLTAAESKKQPRVTREEVADINVQSYLVDILKNLRAEYPKIARQTHNFYSVPRWYKEIMIDELEKVPAEKKNMMRTKFNNEELGMLWDIYS